MSVQAAKPLPGAWVWTFDGNNRSFTCADAKGLFTLKSVPPSGKIRLDFAAGQGHSSQTITTHTNVILSLPIPAKAVVPSTPATRRQHALNLIRKLAAEAEPGEGVRKGNYGHDALANIVAEFDLPLALSLIRPRSGKGADSLLGGMLEVAVRTAPDAVKAVYLKDQNTWQDPFMRYYRYIDMGMAFSARDPTFAHDCYTAAQALIGDGVDANDSWATTQHMRLAFRLNATEADTLFAHTVELTTNSFGNADAARLDAFRYAAEGDGMRAAQHLSELSNDKHEKGALIILRSMADTQPLEASKLLKEWIADGTVKPGSETDADIYFADTYPRLVKALAPFDAEEAAWVAQQTPQRLRWQSELYVASVIQSPAARQKAYQSAVSDERGGDTLNRYAEVFDIARHTGDTNIVSKMRIALLKRMANDKNIYINGSSAAAITYTLGDTLPDICRMLLEMSLQQTREQNPDKTSEPWLVQSQMQAMTWLDLPRALEIADSLGKPESIAQAKYQIVRALLTPPNKWHSLVE